MEFASTRQKLLHLMADGAFHSGTELAKALGVSRTAVWKQMHDLELLGLDVSAVAGKGYRLSRPLELLDANSIIALLEPATRGLISSLEIFREIDSTNRYLATLADKGVQGGAVCLAETQTAGRGRRGKSWVSPLSSNVYLSLLWRFQKGPAAISGLSLAAGVAVMRALKGAGVPGAGLKWPNDIYWQRKKLGGILAEVSGESHGPCSAVLGLGLNFYLPRRTAESIGQPWVDLSQIMGSALPSRNGLIAALLNELAPITADFENSGLAPYLHEWRASDAFLGQKVTLFPGQGAISGTVRGISDAGLLILEDEGGEESHYASGEVTFSG